MFFEIHFFDPDCKRKQQFNRHLRALLNFIKKNSPFTSKELSILSTFNKRSLCIKSIDLIERKTLILNMLGSLRIVFFNKPFEEVTSYISDKLCLTIHSSTKSSCIGEYRKRSKKDVLSQKPIFKSTAPQKVIVEYKKKRIIF